MVEQTICHRKARSTTCRSQTPRSSSINCSNITPGMSTEVLLHEIAPRLCDADPPHGPAFVSTFCELAAAVMGPEAAYVLRVVYANEGVK